MGRLSLISPLKARDPEEAHRVTTQLELFFDLARTAQGAYARPKSLGKTGAQGRTTPSQSIQ
jgi:hypothetical protein